MTNNKTTKTTLSLNIEFECCAADELTTEAIVAAIEEFLGEEGSAVGVDIRVFSYSAYVDFSAKSSGKKKVVVKNQRR